MNSQRPGETAPSCSRHPREAAVVRCQQCGFPLCNECWSHVSGAQPWCTACATEVNTRAVRRWSWAVSFLAVATGAVIVSWRASAVSEDRGYVVFGAIAAAVVFAVLVIRALKKDGAPDVMLRTVEEQVPDPDAALQKPAHPYRARARNAVMRAVPRVSGTQATLLVLVCLGLCAVAFPAAMHLPRWIEVEVVLVAWWGVFAAVLSFLLFKGLRIADDFRFTLSRPGADPKTSAAVTTRKGKSSWLDPSGCTDLGGCSDVEGCGAAVVILLVVGLAAGATWLVAELVMPLFFAASYLLLTRALARVANDKHGCEGDIGRSIGWGAAWATVYVVPIAAAAWAIHAMWRH